MSLESNKKGCSTQQMRLMEALKNREVIRESIDGMSETLSKLEIHKNTLLDVLRIYNNRMNIMVDKYVPPSIVGSCEKSMRDPLIVKGERYMLMLCNIGKIPASNMKSFYGHKYVYPIDYMCKRAYYKHGSAAGEMNGMLFYRCVVRNVCNRPVFEITEGENLCIRGKASEVFSKFRSLFSVSFDFSNLQDFFGLSNAEVRRFISEQDGFQDLDIGGKCSR